MRSWCCCWSSCSCCSSCCCICCSCSARCCSSVSCSCVRPVALPPPPGSAQVSADSAAVGSLVQALCSTKTMQPAMTKYLEQKTVPFDTEVSLCVFSYLTVFVFPVRSVFPPGTGCSSAAGSPCSRPPSQSCRWEAKSYGTSYTYCTSHVIHELGSTHWAGRTKRPEQTYTFRPDSSVGI